MCNEVITSVTQQHEDILWAYRLAGLSAKVEGTTAMLTIETSRSGQYFEPFYLELKFADKIHVLLLPTEISIVFRIVNMLMYFRLGTTLYHILFH